MHAMRVSKHIPEICFMSTVNELISDTKENCTIVIGVLYLKL